MVLLYDRRNIREILLKVLAVGFVYALVQYLVAAFIGPELPNLIAGAVSIFVAVAIFKGERSLGFTKINWSILTPFLIMTLTISLTRLIPPVKALLTHPLVTIDLAFPLKEMVKFQFLFSPGTALIITTLLAARLQGKTSVTGSISRKTVRQVLPVLISISSFVAMANVMKDLGMNSYSF
jgi:lactate permease